MTSKKSSRENKEIKAVIICGPTGSGKSTLGMEIARRYGGSIISADSRQIYRRLDIGTAKPSKEDRKKIPHYMIDVADVTEDFTVMRFAVEAKKNFEQIVSEDRIPLVVGGAGLYIDALTRGIFIGPGTDSDIRGDLEAVIEKEGLPALYDELSRVDPETAGGVSANDRQRIIRALEIYRQSGTKPSRMRQNSDYLKISAEFLWIGLSQPRDVLYDRIDSRVDKMIEDGLIEEIRKLLGDGLGDPIFRKKIVGYYEIIDALNKEDNLENVIGLIKQHSRNYAKRQLTWFRNKTDSSWMDPDDHLFYDKVFSLLDEYLKRT